MNVSASNISHNVLCLGTSTWRITSHGLIPIQLQSYVHSSLFDNLSCFLKAQSLRRTQESDDVTVFAVGNISVSKLQSSPEPISVNNRSSAKDLANINLSAIASIGLESKVIIMIALWKVALLPFPVTLYITHI